LSVLQKEENLSLVVETGIVAVIRAKDPSELLDVIAAIERGGVKAIEVTMTVPGAIDVIREVGLKLKGKVLIGAGTILDAETARLCILAGADFIVSPVFKPEIMSMAKRYSKLVIPGAFTPTEILTAWEAGADAVKVFPATKLGPEFFKDMSGPFPQIRLTPTGGISLDNIGAYIKAGACFVGAGTSLTDKKMIEGARWDELAEHASKFIAEVKKARSC
jgi:2-dehydro-3-deoxyphosphogluconate aldolase/(4S)-4-hydroxy-2-oxoglutarate aldolase